MNIPVHIRSKREELHYTSEEVANAACIPYRFYMDLEEGQLESTHIYYYQLVLVSHLLQITMQEVLAGVTK